MDPEVWHGVPAYYCAVFKPKLGIRAMVQSRFSWRWSQLPRIRRLELTIRIFRFYGPIVYKILDASSCQDSLNFVYTVGDHMLAKLQRSAPCVALQPRYARYVGAQRIENILVPPPEPSAVFSYATIAVSTFQHAGLVNRAARSWSLPHWHSPFNKSKHGIPRAPPYLVLSVLSHASSFPAIYISAWDNAACLKRDPGGTSARSMSCVSNDEKAKAFDTPWATLPDCRSPPLVYPSLPPSTSTDVHNLPRLASTAPPTPILKTGKERTFVPNNIVQLDVSLLVPTVVTDTALGRLRSKKGHAVRYGGHWQAVVINVSRGSGLAGVEQCSIWNRSAGFPRANWVEGGVMNRRRVLGECHSARTFLSSSWPALPSSAARSASQDVDMWTRSFVGGRVDVQQRDDDIQFPSSPASFYSRSRFSAYIPHMLRVHAAPRRGLVL
ncbi:hypothetical protein EVG20_g8377 [Dentipellis fragilis]|uniref:Uncharacterized protein n=1 Tax=Dentipellis fragilis TaxID=205917 RepID=A0A4Y9Y5R9_9AGAM|nr:hypothetical protein EVG20_g8377 [Dentipellis fragilis]